MKSSPCSHDTGDICHLCRPCIKCGARDRSPKNGDCRPCARESRRAYRLRNREAVLRRSRAWRLANPEHVAEYNREYQRAWYQRNREKKIAEVKAYQASRKAAQGPF